jgi:hypothetical protein
MQLDILARTGVGLKFWAHIRATMTKARGSKILANPIDIEKHFRALA